MANILAKLLTLGEGRQLREFEAHRRRRSTRSSPTMQALTDDELRGKTVEFRAALRRRRDARRPAARGVRGVPRGGGARARHAPLRRAAHRRHGAPPRHDRRDEDRRGQDARRHARRSTSTRSPATACTSSPSTTTSPSATASGWAASTAARPRRSASSSRRWTRRSACPRTRPTSPTARTPSSASTTCATTWSSTPDDRVQRGHHFAIVDEVDSILIDEARTPLIISGAGTKSADAYKQFAKVVPRLQAGRGLRARRGEAHDRAHRGGRPQGRAAGSASRTSTRTRPGQMVNHLQQALKAQFMFKRDVDYVVKDGEVLIVDEFTGRLMYGRRYSEGLHQAIEAKEQQHVREENQTLATITLQNYFRMYEKLAGMTGTAVTEDAEFREIYKLPVLVIPHEPADGPRRPRTTSSTARVDAKFDAVVEEIVERHEAGSALPRRHHLDRELRARSRACSRSAASSTTCSTPSSTSMEAHIIAQAGRLGAVTIATNMAGRGTDIVLGGNPDALVDDILLERGVKPEEATDEQRPTRSSAPRRSRPRSTSRSSRRAVWPSSAPSATSRAASTTSCAAVPAARATRASRSSTSRSRTTSCACSAATGWTASARLMERTRDPGRHADPGRARQQGDRERAAPGRGDELRRPQARARVRRRHEQAARGHLRRAQPRSSTARTSTRACRR